MNHLLLFTMRLVFESFFFSMQSIFEIVFIVFEVNLQNVSKFMSLCVLLIFVLDVQFDPQKLIYDTFIASIRYNRIRHAYGNVTFIFNRASQTEKPKKSLYTHRSLKTRKRHTQNVKTKRKQFCKKGTGPTIWERLIYETRNRFLPITNIVEHYSVFGHGRFSKSEYYSPFLHTMKRVSEHRFNLDTIHFEKHYYFAGKYASESSTILKIVSIFSIYLFYIQSIHSKAEKSGWNSRSTSSLATTTGI